jgi:ribose transport system permease protein
MSTTTPADTSSETTSGTTGFRRRLREGQSVQILFVLLVMVAIFSALSPEAFLAVNNFRNIVVNVSILSVLGVGVTYVIITAGIDLSIGSVLVFSGVIASKAMTAAGGEGWGVVLIGLLAALLSGAVWGVLNGVLVAKAKIPSLIVTLGTMGMALGGAQIITGGIDLRGAPYELVEHIGFGRIFGQIPTLSIIAAVILLAGGITLQMTRYGRYTYAVGSNLEAARRSGIQVDRHLISIYALSGITAGMAGFLNLAFFQSTTIGGHSTTNLNAIAAVVIGGTSLFGGIGTIAGTAIGMFIPAVLRNGFIILGVQPFWQQVVVGAVLITAVYIDQTRRRTAMSGGAGKAGPRFLRVRGSNPIRTGDGENT